MLISQPPPSAKPLTAAITGMGKVSSLRNTSLPFLPKASPSALVRGAHLADIGAGHKALFTRSGEDEATDGFLIDRVEGLIQLIQHGAVQRIEGLGTVDGDNTDLAFHFIGDKLHGMSLSLTYFAGAPESRGSPVHY